MNKFSPDVRKRAVSLVLDNEGQHGWSCWQAMVLISAKIGCSVQTLNEWVKSSEVDSGARAGIPTEMAEKIKTLERENRELRQAKEILRKASACFAMAKLERPLKRRFPSSMNTAWSSGSSRFANFCQLHRRLVTRMPPSGWTWTACLPALAAMQL